MANFLMITATSGTNLELAERFAAVARDKGHTADIVDLAEMDLPMFTIAPVSYTHLTLPTKRIV